MALTPDDVAAKTFRRVRFPSWGYAPDEVDAFLDEVESELVRLRGELERARQPVEPAAGAVDVGERDRLEEQVAELRAFEREYRSRLRAHLQEQLRALGGAPEPSDGAVPA